MTPDRLSGIGPEVARQSVVLPLMDKFYSRLTIDERIEARTKLNNYFKTDVPGYANIGEIVNNKPQGSPEFNKANEYANITLLALDKFRDSPEREQIKMLGSWEEKVDYVNRKFTKGSVLVGVEGFVLENIFDQKMPDNNPIVDLPDVDTRKNSDPNLDPRKISNVKIREILEKALNQEKIAKQSGNLGRKGLIGFLEKSILDLAELGEGNERDMVSALLGQMYDNFGGGIENESKQNILKNNKDTTEINQKNLNGEEYQIIEKDIKFKNIREMLDLVEKSGVRSDDLTMNSRLKTILMNIALDENKNNAKAKAIDLPTGIEFSDLSKEIKLRLALNDCYLLASADGAKTLDGISAFLKTTRADDPEHTFDKSNVEFFLCNGANGIPVDAAWDLRQDSYFKYQELINLAVDDVKVREKFPELNNSNIKNEVKNLKDPVMRKNEKYGIYNDLYVNYLFDSDTKRREIVKEYMVVKIMRDKKLADRNIAEKAYELARKLSTATYTDSAANYAFVDGDDLAELHYIKFLRYQDGVEANGIKPAKNKPVGSVFTIKHIDSLIAPVMAYAQKTTAERGPLKPIYSKDLDPSKIGGKSDLQYVLGPIMHKKAQEVKNVLLADLSPKEGLNLSYLQKTYERLNKVMSETSGVGWNTLNPKEYNPNFTLVQKQRLLRTWFIAGMMQRATESPSFGWSRSAYYELERTLFGRGTFIDEDSKKGEIFISKEDWDWINKTYNVKKILGIFEADERRSKRYLFK